MLSVLVACCPLSALITHSAKTQVDIILAQLRDVWERPTVLIIMDAKRRLTVRAAVQSFKPGDTFQAPSMLKKTAAGGDARTTLFCFAGCVCL